jgi:hypothetical protein
MKGRERERERANCVKDQRHNSANCGDDVCVCICATFTHTQREAHGGKREGGKREGEKREEREERGQRWIEERERERERKRG